MPAPADLVYQQTTSTGTGNLTLSSVNGRRTFASAFGTGTTVDVFDYYICNNSASEWEIGTGHILSDGVTLVRDTVSLSSNSNTLVSFGTGIKDVTNDVRANAQVRTSTNSVTNLHLPQYDGTSGNLLKSSGIGFPIPVASGGTGATIAATALSNLSGQPLNSTLTSLGGLSLSSGDTLYATAASTLARLAAGTNGNVLKLASGLPSWGLPFSAKQTTLTTVGSSIFTYQTGIVAALVFCTGGGGGGAGATNGNTGSTTSYKTNTGGGGGSGSTGISFLTTAQLTPTFTATISGTTMTLVSATSGTLAIGHAFTGTGVTAGTYITALVSGTLGVAGSTYTLNQASTVSTATPMTVTGILVTVGAGGAAGTASTATAVPAAGSGSATSFGSLVRGAAGNGAAAYTATVGTNTAQSGDGGLGGLSTASSGLITLAGQNGVKGLGIAQGTFHFGIGGRGGSSFWGNGGVETIAFQNTNNAPSVGGNAPIVNSYGAGGSGAVICFNSTATAALAGGAGASGVCVVFELFAQ